MQQHVAGHDDEPENGIIETVCAAVIEPAHGHDGVVDDDSLLDLLGPVASKESYTDVNVSENLTIYQRAEVMSLLREFSDIFTDKPGTTNLVEHEIVTTTKQPIKVRPYPMPYATREVVMEEVKNLLARDLSEPKKFKRYKGVT